MAKMPWMESPMEDDKKESGRKGKRGGGRKKHRKGRKSSRY